MSLWVGPLVRVVGPPLSGGPHHPSSEPKLAVLSGDCASSIRPPSCHTGSPSSEGALGARASVADWGDHKGERWPENASRCRKSKRDLLCWAQVDDVKTAFISVGCLCRGMRPGRPLIHLPSHKWGPLPNNKMIIGNFLQVIPCRGLLHW